MEAMAPARACRSRQPVDRGHLLRRQADAVGHGAAAVGIIAATAGAEVEQTAGDVGETERAGVVVAQLVQAAAAAAVAQTLPLLARHLVEAFGHPEGGGRRHRPAG